MSSPSDLRAQLQSALGTNYTLERELAAGGMSRVFVAEETRLGRKVVVKILSPHIAGGVSSDRFEREMRLAAALQDPRIVPVLAAGDADGIPYYTMPYVEGESLRARLARGTLPPSEALSILGDVAMALACAHEHGVVHRDVKPENVLLSGRTAVVTDFGIAKALSAAATGVGGAGGATLTQLGTSLGTPAYMAPEQAAGDPDVDHRADIYAWGVIAYELLTGAHPFASKTSPQALIVAHIVEAPPPLDAARSDIPSHVAAVVMQCLEKDPARRPTRMLELVAALAAPAAAVATVAPSSAQPSFADRSIVVLPFVNLSSDPDNEYFSDGLTEELIADLSRVSALKVISRTSSMAFKGSSKAAPQISRELSVRYVLEGSVRKAGTNLRITAQLVDAAGDVQRWADKYAGTLDDVFDLQERVSRDIVRALDVTLSAMEDQSLAKRPAESAAAYDCYLRAKHEVGRASLSGLEEAERLLDDGLRLYGADPLLRATRAHLRVLRLRLSGRPDAALLDAAASEGESILRAHPGFVDAQLLIGVVEFERGRMQAAADNLRLVLERAPGDVEARFWLGLTYLYAGQTNAVRRMGEHLTRQDPLSPTGWSLLAPAAWFDGHFTSAVAYMARALELSDDSTIYRWMWGYGLALAGRHEEAEAEAVRLQRTDPTNPYTWQLTALTCALRGDNAGAAEALRPCAGLWFDHHMAFHIAEGYALQGRVDEALSLLNDAVTRGFFPYDYIARHNPFLASVRQDARFAALSEAARTRRSAFVVGRSKIDWPR